MPFDVYNNFTGQFYGKDRLGFTTPDPEISETLRPFLPIAYPAPWLPMRRQDTGHPQGASDVFTAGQLAGVDKNGCLIPAGLFSGPQGTAGIVSVSTLEVTTGGTAGSTSYTYSVIAKDGNGSTIPAHATLATGNASLSATNYAMLVWDPVPNAIGYDILRASGGTAASGTGSFLIGSTGVTTVFVDGGLTATSYTVPTANTTGNPGQYCVLQYGYLDVGWTFNPQTGAQVASPTEYCVLAAPANATAGDVVTGPYGNITIQSGDITFANACNLIPASTPHPIGYAIRNVFQYIGGVSVASTTGGMNYTINTMNPTGFKVTNYTHEPGTAIQTQAVLRMPWIGATENTIDSLAQGDGTLNLKGQTFKRSNFAKSFVHAVGAAGNSVGQLFPGCRVVAASAGDSAGAGYANGFWASGCYAPYNPAVNTPDQIVGTLLGWQDMYPIQNFNDRVRTQFERGEQLVGPYSEHNATQILMGGSATRGLDYQLNLSGDSVFRAAIDQGKTIHNEYSTYALIRVLL